MPLTSKGSEIMGSMKEQYGEKKGEQVFYASRNKGTISGVDNVVDGAGADATLNWSGGEHVAAPGGPGDVPFSPQEASVAGVEGQAQAQVEVQNYRSSPSGISGVDSVLDFWGRE